MSSIPQHIKLVLENTEPLKWSRGNRLPLYLWPVMDVDTGDDAETESIIRQLDARGIGAISTWNPGRQEETLAKGMRVARIQKRLELPININANPCTYAFCNGNPRTAHISEDGVPFFDESFGKEHKMGCPFALDFRKPEMKKRVEDFVKAYKEANLEIDFIFADWEIDGPIEWNGAWDASKRCRRCRENIPEIDDFTAFQTALRRKRSELQREMLADIVKAYFPDALVGNYGVYPHDGYRYWYDYFERFVEGAPHKRDGNAKYRQWFDEFPMTGYTFAMPVVYTWDTIWNWYDFEKGDYRWFYNMLLVGSNAGENTPRQIPIITFVHWHTVETTGKDESIKQFSEEKYQELLWHLLLRGHDGFFVWCPREQTAVETRLVHQVYAESLQYREFLNAGEPITFDVPPQPGPVVSGLKLGDRLLLRRTDFDDTEVPVTLVVDGMKIEVLRVDGRCQVRKLW
ncbi:TPA: hypothetical protein EYP66_00765 [Candidatus Poribacteria bacterium]|nr:hypothetical protein [Candidatus Poribacteria bacterium]